MSTPHCPVPDRKLVVAETYTVHPAGACPEAEELADGLDLESRAHAQARQALVDASRELERLLQVEKVACAVLRVCDAPTTLETTESRALELVGVLAVLRAVLQGEEVPALLKEMLTNLGMGSAGSEGVRHG